MKNYKRFGHSPSSVSLFLADYSSIQLLIFLNSFVKHIRYS